MFIDASITNTFGNLLNGPFQIVNTTSNDSQNRGVVSKAVHSAMFARIMLFYLMSKERSKDNSLTPEEWRNLQVANRPDFESAIRLLSAVVIDVSFDLRVLYRKVEDLFNLSNNFWVVIDEANALVKDFDCFRSHQHSEPIPLLSAVVSQLNRHFRRIYVAGSHLAISSVEFVFPQGIKDEKEYRNLVKIYSRFM